MTPLTPLTPLTRTTLALLLTSIAATVVVGQTPTTHRLLATPETVALH